MTEAKFKVGEMARVVPGFPSPRRGLTGKVVAVHAGDVVELEFACLECQQYIFNSADLLPAPEPSATAGESEPAEQVKADPYTKHRLYEETLSVAVVDHYAGNQAARLRNIAALRAEQSKPFAPRFPSVGRDSRVFGERRWGEK